MFFSFKKPTLKTIIRDMVRQGPQHQNNIVKIYKEVFDACSDEFTEDSKETIKSYLTENFNKSIS